MNLSPQQAMCSNWRSALSRRARKGPARPGLLAAALPPDDNSAVVPVSVRLPGQHPATLLDVPKCSAVAYQNGLPAVVLAAGLRPLADAAIRAGLDWPGR